MTTDEVFAVVLGVAQDAGIPHIGCVCPRCRRGERHYAAALALVDASQQPAAVFLIDATPDITPQLAHLGRWLGPDPRRPDRLRQPDALLLTHAHMGHTAGLAQLGPEGMFVQDLTVYGSEALGRAVAANPFWAPL